MGNLGIESQYIIIVAVVLLLLLVVKRQKKNRKMTKVTDPLFAVSS